MTRESCAVNLNILVLLVLHKEPISAQEVVKFGWTMWHAREVKLPLWIVSTEDGVHTTAVIVKMHQ